MDKDGLHPVDVVIIGAPYVRACSGCNAGRTMQEMAKALGRRLHSQFPNLIKYRYIDVTKDDMKDYPQIKAALESKSMTLPIAMVNGTPVLPGMFSPTMITYRIKQELQSSTLRR